MATHIDWIEDQDATGELASLYQNWKEKNPGREEIPDILKCFSLSPSFLRDIIRASDAVHFTDGHLDRRTKEMIATYVSGLNQCPYWIGSHAYFLQLQDGTDDLVQALLNDNLLHKSVSEKEQYLLTFVKQVTEHAYQTSRDDIDVLRQSGWTDPEIAETVYITALFAFFNRVADAFGLTDPGYR